MAKDNFDVEFKKASKRIIEKYDKVFQKSATELSKKVVDRTPVGRPELWKTRAPLGYRPGKLKGNWEASVGHDYGSYNEGRLDPVGNKTKSAIRKAFESLKLRYEGILSNKTPYAEEIENGYSKQSPAGMVKVSMVGWEDIVKKWVKRIRV